MPELWKMESQPTLQRAGAVGSVVLGGVLMWGFSDFGEFAMSNEFAGFLLGVLLVLIGLPGLIVAGKQVTIVDPKSRRIIIEDVTRFSRKKRTIDFTEISGITVSYLGRASNYSKFYYINLELRSGGDYPLFAPGRFYKGSSNRMTVEGWRSRLEKMVNDEQFPDADPFV